MNIISIRDAISYGFRSVINNFGTFLVPELIIGVISVGCCLPLVLWLIFPFIFSLLIPAHVLLFFIWWIVLIMGYSLIIRSLMAGYIKGLLTWQSTHDFPIKMIFSCFNQAFSLWMATLLYSFFTLLGLIFFIIPGIYIFTRYSFFVYFMIEEHCGIFESFRKSSQLVEGNFWRILGLSIIEMALLQLGVALVVGWLFTYPATQLARIYIYNRLKSKRHETLNDYVI